MHSLKWLHHCHCRTLNGCFLSTLPQAVISLLDILLERYGCDWSRRDIQRMELVVMQQLGFNLSRPTVLDFITSVCEKQEMYGLSEIIAVAFFYTCKAIIGTVRSYLAWSGLWMSSRNVKCFVSIFYFTCTLQFHSLAMSSGLICLPPGLSVDSHLKHMAVCTQPVVYNSHLMKHRVSASCWGWHFYTRIMYTFTHMSGM